MPLCNISGRVQIACGFNIICGVFHNPEQLFKLCVFSQSTSISSKVSASFLVWWVAYVKMVCCLAVHADRKISQDTIYERFVSIEVGPYTIEDWHAWSFYWYPPLFWCLKHAFILWTRAQQFVIHRFKTDQFSSQQKLEPLLLPQKPYRPEVFGPA